MQVKKYALRQKQQNMLDGNLRLSFDEVAEAYDAVRPAYPAELVEAIGTVLEGTQGRILEIGCGTGQATLPFARQGYPITALEPGPKLARIAAKNLAAFPQADVQSSTFEDWVAAAGQYDLVMSATAFHWVSPEVRYAKSAEALAANGWFALFWNIEADDDSELGQQIQAVYDEHMPPNPAHPYATHHPAGRRKQKVSRWQDEINQSHLFGDVDVKQFSWQAWYPTSQYLKLLETYSDHRALPPKNKIRLFEGIAEILDRHGGRRKPYLAVLYLAQVRKLP